MKDLEVFFFRLKESGDLTPVHLIPFILGIFIFIRVTEGKRDRTGVPTLHVSGAGIAFIDYIRRLFYFHSAYCRCFILS